MELQRRCENCKFAEWDSERVNFGHGSYHDIWNICGCKLTEKEQDEIEQEAINDGEPIGEFNSAWGDTEDCPYWREEI